MQENLGCDKTTQAPVWLDEEDEFFNCPRKFIPIQCVELMEELEAYKANYARPVEFAKRSNRFLEAAQCYHFYFDRYQIEIMQRPNKNEVNTNVQAFGE